MKTTPLLKSALTLGLAALWTINSQAVEVTFGETTAPTEDIITFYDPELQNAFTWLNSNGTNRVVAQSFLTPAGGIFEMTAISMKLGTTIRENFTAPSEFTIDFYKLTSPGENPVLGQFVVTQTGTMQPTTAEAAAGTFLTFALDTPLTLEPETSYGFVLAFTEQASYNYLALAISAGDRDPAGTRVWYSQNGSSWAPINETYVYYIQGAAIPEPSIMALGALALAGLGWHQLRVRRKSAV